MIGRLYLMGEEQSPGRVSNDRTRGLFVALVLLPYWLFTPPTDTPVSEVLDSCLLLSSFFHPSLFPCFPVPSPSCPPPPILLPRLRSYHTLVLVLLALFLLFLHLLLLVFPFYSRLPSSSYFSLFLYLSSSFPTIYPLLPPFSYVGRAIKCSLC